MVGEIMAEYGVKMDADDPAVIIVAMCVKALAKQIAQTPMRAAPPGASAEALAQATATAYASKVLPQLQAVVSTEIKKVVAALRPATIWTHPAFVAVSSGLVGVIVGFILRRLA